VVGFFVARGENRLDVFLLAGRTSSSSAACGFGEVEFTFIVACSLAGHIQEWASCWLSSLVAGKSLGRRHFHPFCWSCNFLIVAACKCGMRGRDIKKGRC
jgi:hypothetical protein